MCRIFFNFLPSFASLPKCPGPTLPHSFSIHLCLHPSKSILLGCPEISDLLKHVSVNPPPPPSDELFFFPPLFSLEFWSLVNNWVSGGVPFLTFLFLKLSFTPSIPKNDLNLSPSSPLFSNSFNALYCIPLTGNRLTSGWS